MRDLPAAIMRIRMREATGLARLGACGLALLLVIGLVLRLDATTDSDLLVLPLGLIGAFLIVLLTTAPRALILCGLQGALRWTQ